MKAFLLMALLLALVGLVMRRFSRRPICLANSYDPAIGTHTFKVSRKADGAIARFLLLKEGTDADHVDICDADDEPVGNSNDESAAAEDRLHVYQLGITPETRLMVASEAIDEREWVYTAAGGKVQNEPSAAGNYWRVGKAAKPATADADLIEVRPCTPVPLTVIAMLTSTNGTAGAAADLTALKAEAEKIGDDVRAIGAALVAPGLVKVLTS